MHKNLVKKQNIPAQRPVFLFIKILLKEGVGMSKGKDCKYPKLKNNNGAGQNREGKGTGKRRVVTVTTRNSKGEESSRFMNY